MAETQEELTQQSDALYAKYVKPLEKDHPGEFIAVSPDGQTVLAPTLLDVMKQAEQRLGEGNFVFKVGEVAVDTLRFAFSNAGCADVLYCSGR